MNTKARMFANGTLPTVLTSLLAFSPVGASGNESTVDSGGAGPLAEITVTAQKREESVNDVGMTISAFSADALREVGVAEARDLVKVVPGLWYAHALYGTPVYTLRGIGFNDTSSAASPGVAIYVDEIPLPFPVEAAIAPTDLGHVEVLKGPQGTLFGQNSTGGAINFVTARPTDALQAGLSTSYGRFDDWTAEGFVSGPLSSSVSARLSVRAEYSDDWQRNYVRDDSLGAKRKLSGRVRLDWAAREGLDFMFSLSGWKDRSDQPAPQFVGLRPDTPALGLTPLPDQPVAPRDNRAADWSPDRDPRRDQSFYQAALRAELAATSSVKLISITSAQRFRKDDFTDADGTQFEALDMGTPSDIDSVYQELRLTGETGPWNWIVGANYGRDEVTESLEWFFRDATAARLFLPFVAWNHVIATSEHEIRTAAGFGHVEYRLSDAVALQSALRYTEVERDFEACARDSGDGLAAAAFELYQSLFKGPADVVPIPPGGCFTLNSNVDPALTRMTSQEDNVSWRVALNWTPTEDFLGYVSVTRGYKSGGFPLAIAAQTGSYVTMEQESVLAYEIGGKATMPARGMQLNGAVFYYDYEDKQLQGKRTDAFFGPLNAYVNVPESEVYGAELQLDWMPTDRFSITGAVTYLHTEVTKSFVNYNTLSEEIDFAGSQFPFTPEWSGMLDAVYRWPVSDRLAMSIGAHADATSGSPSSLGAAPMFRIPGRTLYDARIGFEPIDGLWRLAFWIRNLTDKYYWTDRQISQDPVFQNAGYPRTYGVTFSYRWH